MKPVGKTMKVCHHQGKSESEGLKAALGNYRQTPNVVTGIAPASMLFRDVVRSEFPRVSVTKTDVEAAREK